MKEMQTIWGFVEKYYPNYDSSDDIAEAEDLYKIINNEPMQKGTDAYNLFIEEYQGNLELAKERYNELHVRIYEQAILAFQNSLTDL